VVWVKTGDEGAWRLSMALPAPSAWDRCMAGLGLPPQNTHIFQLFDGDPAAVPVLTELLRDHDSDVRELVETILESRPHTKK
jgi:hypothetical protein